MASKKTVNGIYSETPLLWSPWKPGKVSCNNIEVSSFYFYEESVFGTWQNVLNTEVSLFQGCPL